MVSGRASESVSQGGNPGVTRTTQRLLEHWNVLVCARGGYVAVDVKHHRTINTGDSGLLTSTLAVPTPSAAAVVADSELRASNDDALQLAHYRRMLHGQGRAAPTSLGGIIGKERLVIWYDLDEPMWTTPAKSDGKRRKRRTTMEVYDFEFEFRRDKAADAVAGRPLLPPVRIADYAGCGWRDQCNVDLEAGSGDAQPGKSNTAVIDRHDPCS